MGRRALTEAEKKYKRLLFLLSGYKKESQLTNEDLAKRLSCSAVTVSHMMNGRSEIPVRLLMEMIRVFRIPEEEISKCL